MKTPDFEWVVVSSIERMLVPATRREYATYDKTTGEWVGWTTPGYRQRRGTRIDWFPTLLDAMNVVRQMRPRYPHVTAVCLVRGRTTAGGVLARSVPSPST